MRKILCLFAASLAALSLAAAAHADPRISATAVANPDRTVTFTWNVPSSLEWGGAVIVNPTATTDSTGELPFNAGITLGYALTGYGTTSVIMAHPLNLNISQPLTVYAQVQLIDPFGDGSCSQGDFFSDCDSQIIPITIQPICAQVLQTAAYYTRVRVHRGHWLRRNGHYVIRHGHRVWIKPVYRRVYHPAVYATQCH